MEKQDMRAIPFKALASSRPYATLARMRSDAPLALVSTPFTDERFVMVSRNADVLSVAENANAFSSSGHEQARRFGYGATPESDRIYDEKGWPLRPALVWTDGVTHVRVRRLVDKIFAPRQGRCQDADDQRFHRRTDRCFSRIGPCRFRARFRDQPADHDHYAGTGVRARPAPARTAGDRLRVTRQRSVCFSEPVERAPALDNCALPFLNLTLARAKG